VDNIKFPLGIGIGIGVCSVWALVELWPIIALGGATYLIVKGLHENYTSNQENTTCKTGTEKK
jgi:hypothetical protein